MCKIAKQIFKGHITHIMSILIFILFFLLFSLLNFDFTIYFYILVLYLVFGKYKLGSSIIDQTGKTEFTAEFLTVANILRVT